MRSKKDMLGIILGIVIILGVVILGVVIATIFFYTQTYPKNKLICEKDFKMYELLQCVNNLEYIKVCHNLNATWIKTEMHLFSSSVLICYKDGEIIRV